MTIRGKVQKFATPDRMMNDLVSAAMAQWLRAIADRDEHNVSLVCPAPGSRSMAGHVALREAGAAFELRTIVLADRQNDPPEFRTRNPDGKVPTLVADVRPLTKVAAIL